MSFRLRYGLNSALDLPLQPEQVAGLFRPETSGSSATPAEATRAALAAPHKFPRLSQAIVPGDKVALAVDRFVPQVEEIVGAIVEELSAHGVATDDVVVVEAEASAAARVRSLAAASSGRDDRGLHYEIHDPTNRGRLGYLTNGKSGRPIYLNRSLLDADVVIAVGCGRGRRSWNYRGAFGGIYPTFSDAESLARFRNPRVLDRSDDVFVKSQHEVETVGWLSGTQFAVLALPGEADDLATVVAGEVSTIDEVVEPWWNKTWVGRTERRVDTVVAALGGALAQTWEHVGRALAAALEVVEPGGAIVLCTDLDQPLGPGLRQLSEAEDRDAALAKLRKERPRDLLETWEIVAAQERARVYLLSRLDPADVEPAGFVPIESPADVGRFAARRRSCLALADAQYATVIPNDVGDGATS